ILPRYADDPRAAAVADPGIGRLRDDLPRPHLGGQAGDSLAIRRHAASGARRVRIRSLCEFGRARCGVWAAAKIAYNRYSERRCAYHGAHITVRISRCAYHGAHITAHLTAHLTLSSLDAGGASGPPLPLALVMWPPMVVVSCQGSEI